MPTRYNSVSVTLHWLIAALIATNFLLAWSMEGYLESKDPAAQATGVLLINTHKSVGLTVLALSLGRLLWRLTHGFLPLPPRMPVWQRLLARGTHLGFYVLMIGLPLIGWAMVSADPRRFPIPWFGLFEVPRLPVPLSRALSEQLGGAHGAAATMLLVLLALHVVGALKHQLLDRLPELQRMIPGLGAARSR